MPEQISTVNIDNYVAETWDDQIRVVKAEIKKLGSNEDIEEIKAVISRGEQFFEVVINDILVQLKIDNEDLVNHVKGTFINIFTNSIHNAKILASTFMLEDTIKILDDEMSRLVEKYNPGRKTMRQKTLENLGET